MPKETLASLVGLLLYICVVGNPQPEAIGHSCRQPESGASRTCTACSVVNWGVTHSYHGSYTPSGQCVEGPPFVNYPLTTYDLHGCSAGLEVDPANEGFKTELENLRRPPRSAGGGFFGPEILGKLALNPATAPLLSQPEFIHMIQDVNKNPNNMSKCVPFLQPLYTLASLAPVYQLIEDLLPLRLSFVVIGMLAQAWKC